jgi:SAM-dependent methyltransferase
MTCPACGAPGWVDLGPLRDAEGLWQSAPTSLRHCRRCDLYFRHPAPEPGELLQRYAGLPSHCWSDNASRTDFALVAAVLARSLAGPAVLEVGCFRGDFLATLPAHLQKYGVEPCAAAGTVATGRGITLLGADVQTARLDAAHFDAILLLDVLEHLPRPMDALRGLRPHLAERGVLVIATGNTASLPWRLMRRDHWYYVTEHVCFFSPAWFAWAARELDLQVRLVQKYSHAPAWPARRAWQLARCVAHRLRGPGAAPPRAMAWKDHVLVALAPRRAA